MKFFSNRDPLSLLSFLGRIRSTFIALRLKQRAASSLTPRYLQVLSAKADSSFGVLRTVPMICARFAASETENLLSKDSGLILKEANKNMFTASQPLQKADSEVWHTLGFSAKVCAGNFTGCSLAGTLACVVSLMIYAIFAAQVKWFLLRVQVDRYIAQTLTPAR